MAYATVMLSAAPCYRYSSKTRRAESEQQLVYEPRFISEEPTRSRGASGSLSYNLSSALGCGPKHRNLGRGCESSRPRRIDGTTSAPARRARFTRGCRAPLSVSRPQPSSISGHLSSMGPSTQTRRESDLCDSRRVPPTSTMASITSSPPSEQLPTAKVRGIGDGSEWCFRFHHPCAR